MWVRVFIDIIYWDGGGRFVLYYCDICQHSFIIFQFYPIVLDTLAFERLLGRMEILKRNETELKEMMRNTFGSKVKIIHLNYECSKF